MGEYQPVSPECIALEVLEFVKGTSFRNKDERRIRINQGYRQPEEPSIDITDLRGYIGNNYHAVSVDRVMACFLLVPKGNPKETGFYVIIKPEVLKTIKNKVS